MGFRVNENIPALNTQSYLRRHQSGLSQSIERLSSGVRINRGADDAAGLTISEKFRAQIRGLSRSIGNAQDGISLIQTAEGALNEDHSILNRMRELSIQSQDDALTSNDRMELQKEVDELISEVDRISQTTEFNTKKLIDGSASGLASTDKKELAAFQTGTLIAAGDYAVELSLLNVGNRQELTGAIQRSSKTQREAGLQTRLGDLISMSDSEGNNFLENPETLTLRGNGNQVDIVMNSSMTTEDFAAKVENAIVRDEEEGGLGITGSVFRFDTSSAQFIYNAGKDGDSGELSFSADEGVVNALAFEVSVEAQAAAYKVTAMQQGVATPEFFSTETTSDRAFGILGGLDITFELATEARVDGELAGTDSIQTNATDVVFTIHDTNAGDNGQAAGSISAGVTITLTASRTYSTTSVATMITNAVAAANDPTNALTGATSSSYSAPGFTVNFDPLNNLVITSSDTGTSGTISIAANAEATSVLGITSSTTTGAGGSDALLSGANIAGGVTFGGAGVIRIQVGDGDFNQGPSATSSDITFNQGVVITAASIITEFNNYFAAEGVNATAVNNGGILELRSTETGSDARVSISSNASMAAIGMVSGSSAVGAAGTAAIFTGATNSANETTGYTLGGYMQFAIADQNGSTSGGITIGTSNTTSTESFTISQSQLSSILDNSSLGSTAISYSFDETGNLDFVSRSPGNNSKIVFTSNNSSQTIGQNAFGIDFNKESQGTGKINFDLHVTDRTLQFEVGANQGQTLGFQIANASSEALGLRGLDITNIHSATKALGKIDDAISRVSSERSKLGSVQNRFGSAVNTLTSSHTQQSAFESQIRDVDIAKETVSFTRNQIMTQAATAQLAQSKGFNQGALQLLG
jgi:flagellin